MIDGTDETPDAASGGVDRPLDAASADPARDTASEAAAAGDVTAASGYEPPPPVQWTPPDPALSAAVARDLARGRRLIASTWFIALLHAVLCLIAVREVALLGAVDG